MRTPVRLEPLLDDHIIDEVVCQLQSGKEAEVYVVRVKETLYCAKVYKGVNDRSFKNRSPYTEGRKVRNSRQARAMEKGSRYGRKERESEWQNAEVDALFLLANAGVHVPKPHIFYEGVLLLEMITDSEGYAAPRLSDVELTPAKAREYHLFLIKQAVLMLCAGLVHGDLSEFNVLLSDKGLVIIDFPQVVQSTAQNAFAIFERDINQLTAFFAQWAPEILHSKYALEIWKLYQNGNLTPSSALTGRYVDVSQKANVKSLLREIDEVRAEAMEKLKPGGRKF